MGLQGICTGRMNAGTWQMPSVLWLVRRDLCDGTVWTLKVSLLSLHSVSSLEEDRVACALPLNLPTWEPKWLWWRRGTPSPGTMCCTSGPSLSMTCGAWGPRSSMGNSALVPLTTLVSGALGGVLQDDPGLTVHGLILPHLGVPNGPLTMDDPYIQLSVLPGGLCISYILWLRPNSSQGSA